MHTITYRKIFDFFRNHFQPAVVSLTCGALLLGSFPVFAQSSTDERVLEEVTVTAMRREQTVREVAGAITAFNADALDRMHIVSVEEIAARTPNFTMTEFNLAQPRLFIRGIGSTDDGAAQDNSVAVFMDEVYMARGAAQAFEFYDVERIEVLRGPQGTLYGKNVVGGVVNVVSAQPQKEFAASGDLTVGNYENVKARGMVTGAIGEHTAGRLSFVVQDRGGYAENLLTGRELETRELFAIRGQLQWDTSEQVTALLAIDYSDHEDNGQSRKGEGPFGPTPFGSVTAVQSSTDPRVSESPREPYQKRELWGLTGRLEWDIDIGMLTSITAYRESDVDLMDAFTGIGSPPYPVLDTANFEIEKADQLSQEFRLAFDVSDRLNAMVGLYYLSENVDRTEIAELESVLGRLLPNVLGSLVGTSGSFQQAQNKSLGIFANAVYDFSERLSMNVGARYSYEEKDIRTAVVSLVDFGCCIAAPPTEEYDIANVETWDAFTPSLSLEYKLSDQVNAYATISNGFKSGGFQGQAPTGAAAQTPFDPEYAWNYELGVKSALLDNHLTLNVAGFYTDYEDLQVRQNATRPGETIPIIRITNAGSATVQGIEVEVNAMLSDGVMAWGSYSYLDSEFGPFVDNNGNSVEGNRLPFSPENKFDIGLRFDRAIGGGKEVFGQLHYSWQDDYFSEPGNAPVHLVENYGLLNASIGIVFGDGKWRLEAWGKNLSDELYQVHFIPFLGDRFTTYGAPRTYGLTLALNYR